MRNKPVWAYLPIPGTQILDSCRFACEQPSATRIIFPIGIPALFSKKPLVRNVGKVLEDMDVSHDNLQLGKILSD